MDVGGGLSPGGSFGSDAEPHRTRVCGSLTAEGNSVAAAWLRDSRVLRALTHSHLCMENDVCITANKSISHKSIHSQHSLLLSCFSSFLAAGWIKSPLVTMASREEVTLSEEEVR